MINNISFRGILKTNNNGQYREEKSNGKLVKEFTTRVRHEVAKSTNLQLENNVFQKAENVTDRIPINVLYTYNTVSGNRKLCYNDNGDGLTISLTDSNDVINTELSYSKSEIEELKNSKNKDKEEEWIAIRLFQFLFSILPMLSGNKKG
ncbi:MAG: hypothetical protein AB1782_03670 [Cyanobacteriota bacterium]